MHTETRKFGDYERTLVRYRLDRARNIHMRPVPRKRRQFTDGNGGEVWILGVYGDWQQIEASALNGGSPPLAKRLLVVPIAVAGEDGLQGKMQVFAGSMEEFARRFRKPSEPRPRYELRFDIVAERLRIEGAPGYSMEKVDEFPYELEPSEEKLKLLKAIDTITPEQRDRLLSLAKIENFLA